MASRDSSPPPLVPPKQIVRQRATAAGAALSLSPAGSPASRKSVRFAPPRTPLPTIEEARRARAAAAATPPAAPPAPLAAPPAAPRTSAWRARLPPGLPNLLAKALPNTTKTSHIASLQKLRTNRQLVLKEGQEVDDWT
jgi:hypothetical protein